MISEALSFITDHLNEFLIRKASSNKSLVKLSTLVKQDKDESDIEDTLLLSLVNISEETSITNQTSLRQGDTIKSAPPVFINLQILISASFSDNQYKEGLQMLSSAISFFQQQPHFNSQLVNMPKGIDKLSFELVNLNIDSMGEFWRAMGTHYRPSVVYKMRMLKISEDNIESTLPEIENPRVTN